MSTTPPPMSWAKWFLRTSLLASAKISSMRGSIIEASMWREISFSARPPTPDTPTISSPLTSDASAAPCWILMASALSIGVRSPIAMSLVTFAPPNGMFTTAHFHVMSMESAFTSSSVTAFRPPTVPSAGCP